jgi:hypothetical protein
MPLTELICAKVPLFFRRCSSLRAGSVLSTLESIAVCGVTEAVGHAVRSSGERVALGLAQADVRPKGTRRELLELVLGKGPLQSPCLCFPHAISPLLIKHIDRSIPDIETYEPWKKEAVRLLVLLVAQVWPSG